MIAAKCFSPAPYLDVSISIEVDSSVWDEVVEILKDSILIILTVLYMTYDTCHVNKSRKSP